MLTKRHDLPIVVCFEIFAALVTVRAAPKLVVSAFLFFALPALYLHVRSRFSFNYTKIIAAVLSLGVSLSALDFAMSSNQGWTLPPEQMLVVPGMFGFWSFDNTIWALFYVFFLVSFYEYFLDDERSRILSTDFSRFVWLPISVTALVFFLGFCTPPLTHPIIPYAYLSLVTIPVLFPLAVLIYRKKNLLTLLGKFTLANAFIAVVNLVHELTALSAHQWYFAGEYIGQVAIFGIAFPIEEFVLYVLLSGYAFLAYYELYVDDGR